LSATIPPLGAAQEVPAAQASAGVEHGPHHRIQPAVSAVIDGNGNTVFQTNRIIELGAGLHRRDPDTGEWVAAKAEFEALPDGFIVARQTAHQVILSGNLNVE
jgi:hypothetical protein